MEFQQVNLDLIVPIVLIFLIMRMDFQQLLLHTLKYYVATSERIYFLKSIPASELSSLHKDNQSLIEKSIQYSLLDIDSTVQKKHLISKQPFHKFYKVMIILLTSAVITHAWYVSYHCYDAQAIHMSWSIFLSLSALILAIQSQWNILLLTGWHAFESKVALNLGILAFVGLSILLFAFENLLGFNVPLIFDSIAAHCNALLLQLSANPMQLNEYAMSHLLRLVVALVYGGIVASLVVPTMRFSQNFISMQYGIERATTPSLTKLLLWVDMFIPIVLSTLLLPIVWTGLSTLLSYQDFISIPAGLFLEQNIRSVQIGVVVVLGLTRLAIVRPLLQSMLDTTVRMVMTVIKLGNVNKETKPLLQEKLMVVGNYLAAGGSQLVAFPALVISSMILVHRLTPGGTGICVLTRSALGYDVSAIVEAAEAARMFDATATAREQAVAPFLDQALHSFLMGTGMGGHSPSEYLRTFIARGSFLYALPPAEAMQLILLLLSLSCAAQTMLSLLTLTYWRRGTSSTDAPATAQEPPATSEEVKPKLDKKKD